MAVVIETTLGDITVDLFIEERPQTCKNFLKLCKMKYYNFNLFHSVQSNFLAQTGDPTGTGNGGESIFGLVMGSDARYFEGEKTPKIKHNRPGLLSMVNCGNSMLGSQFFITLGTNLSSLDDHCVFAEVMEGQEVLLKLNETICDSLFRPYQDVRITHTVILEDPFEDLVGMIVPDASPDRSKMMASGRIGADESIVEKDKSETELAELRAEQEAKARATILEIVGDLPEADAAPPENVLFVCKLNPVTTDEDLELIFRRFGNIKSCEVIRDKLTGESLQYAFIEFEDKKACELAYEKMENTLIDDRRIHVDFSQSVAKLRWKGKGRGVEHITTNDEATKNTSNRRTNERNESGSRSASNISSDKRGEIQRNDDRKNIKSSHSNLDNLRRNDSRRSRSRERSERKYNEISDDNRRRKEMKKDRDDLNYYDRKESRGIERNSRNDNRGVDRDYERDRGKDRDKNRDMGRERIRDKDREREKDRGRDKEKDRERDRLRDRDKDREKERDKEKDGRYDVRSSERYVNEGRREERKRKGSEDRNRMEDYGRKPDESSSQYHSKTKQRREERSETRISSSSRNGGNHQKADSQNLHDVWSGRSSDRGKESVGSTRSKEEKYDRVERVDGKAHFRSQSDILREEGLRNLKDQHPLPDEKQSLGDNMERRGKLEFDNERRLVVDSNHTSSPFSCNSPSSSSKQNAIERSDVSPKKTHVTNAKRSKRRSSSSSVSSSSDSSSDSNSDSNSSSSSSVDMTVAKKYYNHKGQLVRKVITKKQKNKDSKKKSKRKNDKVVVIKKKIKKRQSSTDDDSESSSDESSDDRHKRHRKFKSAKKKSKKKYSNSDSDSSDSKSSSKHKRKKLKKKPKHDSSSD